MRLFSGRRADRTGRYWPITITGYVLQMSVVPLLALAGNWQMAAVLIIAERIGKGIRNPPRDAMLSQAAKDIGYGRAFGVHEALDQCGALFGPLLVALVIAVDRHDHAAAFAVLAIPAVIMLSLLAVARMLYPRPQDLAAGEHAKRHNHENENPRQQDRTTSTQYKHERKEEARYADQSDARPAGGRA